jgi:hypothetical protein
MSALGEWWAGIQRDTAAKAQLIRTVFWLYPAALIMLGLFAFFLWRREVIGDSVFRLILILNIPVAFLLVLSVSHGIGRFSEGLVRVMHGAGNIPPGPAFSIEDGMVTRGDYLQAREALQSRLSGGRDDLAIQLRLAELSARWLRDAPAAEQWYLAARRGSPSLDQQAAICNGLIELYRVGGRGGRLQVELARFISLFPGTRAAEGARRELRELKEGEPA